MILKNKVVVVTGASGVIGRAIAQACVREGASVVLASRSDDALIESVEVIRKEFGSEARVLPVPCNVAFDQDVKDLVSKSETAFGPIYGMVCAAGIYGAIGLIEDISLDHWMESLQVNLLGTLRCVQAIVPQMKKRHSGRIILFSGGGQGAMPRFSSYVASKGAIWRITETLGTELAPEGIYLNAIAPGPVKSGFLEDLIAAGPEKVGHEKYEEALKQAQEKGPSSEKAGELALFLLSEKTKDLYGKIVSALYDHYWEIENPADVSKSDLFAMRRVVTNTGGTKYADR